MGGKGIKHTEFLVIDLLAQQLAFVLSYAYCFPGDSPYRSREYLNLAVIFALLDICVTFAGGMLEDTLKRGYYKEFSAVLRQVLLVEGMAFVYLFEVRNTLTNYPKAFIYGMIPLYILLVYGGRIFWKNQLKKMGGWGQGGSLLILAPKNRIEEGIRSICRTNYNVFASVKAVVTDADYTGQTLEGIQVVSSYEGVLEYIRNQWVDEVLLVVDLENGYPKELVEKLRQIRIGVHITLTEAGTIRENTQMIERMGNYMVLTTGVNRATPLQLSLKRLMDIAGGLVGCLITGVLFLLLALPIYLSSPGPIFFAQERMGRNGKSFKLYKFRTMVPQADKLKQELMAYNQMEGGRMFKMEDDPRIIGLKRMADGTVKKGIGSFLRETSLDEFPQMFNVLRGDMSLVGTRPPTVDEWEQYEFHHRVRLAFRPGLTGLWQTSGRNQITDFEEVVKLDTQYIDEWSLGLDIKILFKTLGAILHRRGAL